MLAGLRSTKLKEASYFVRDEKDKNKDELDLLEECGLMFIELSAMRNKSPGGNVNPSVNIGTRCVI